MHALHRRNGKDRVQRHAIRRNLHLAEAMREIRIDRQLLRRGLIEPGRTGFVRRNERRGARQSDEQTGFLASVRHVGQNGRVDRLLRERIGRGVVAKETCVCDSEIKTERTLRKLGIVEFQARTVDMRAFRCEIIDIRGRLGTATRGLRLLGIGEKKLRCQYSQWTAGRD